MDHSAHRWGVGVGYGPTDSTKSESADSAALLWLASNGGTYLSDIEISHDYDSVTTPAVAGSFASRSDSLYA